MKILAIDLGKRKSVFCEYQTAGGEAGAIYGKIDTHRQGVEALLIRVRPDRLVIEAGSALGWVADVARELRVPVQVANVNDPRWHWKKVKNKSDRKDGLKMAQMSQLDCLPMVHVPHPRTRQWRSLIEYRAGLVSRRTAVKNSIRAIYDRRGCCLIGGDHVWTKAGLADLQKDARPAAKAAAGELWRVQVYCELRELESVQRDIDEVEEALAGEARERPEVKLLQTAPMVGPRLSETVAAVLDDPHRFANGREVGGLRRADAAAVGQRPKRAPRGSGQPPGPCAVAGAIGGGVVAGGAVGAVDDQGLRGREARQRQAKEGGHRGGGPATLGAAVGDVA